MGQDHQLFRNNNETDQSVLLTMPRVRTEAKSRAILAAASQIFQSREFHEVLIDDIAALAGTGKGTIYRYFSTKEELFFVSVLHGLDDLHAALSRELAEKESLRARLSSIGTLVLRFSWNQKDIVTLLHRDERLFTKRKTEFEERRQRIVTLVAQSIEEGMRRRELRELNPRTGAEVFLGMLRGLNMWRRQTDTIDELVAVSLDVFLNGVARRTDT
jgi:TetR/AcrR family fatty acid metabolism transcriptional regulator